jgi:TonB family protein
MRPAQSPAIDFNQMLVVSVFFHFLMFTVFMFLPQTQKIVRHIKPAFIVSLINIPAGPDIQPAPPAEETPIAPLPPETPVAEQPISQEPEPIPEPKPIPEKPAASKALVSKLDQLAQLEKKRTIPKKDKMAMAVPKPKESVLEDFKNMKMKTATEKKKEPTRKKIANDDLTLKELEFERLSKKTATDQPRNKPKKKSNLLKELDELDQLNKQARVTLDKPKIKKTSPKATELLKQLESIKKESVQIKIDTSKLSSRHSQKFKSEIRDLKITEFQKRVTAPAAFGELGDPDADALSIYVGKVYVKIFKNWKDPLGGGNGRVQVSFSIFPRGNIAMPKILKSSGDPKLDNLAIRAIKNAVPLPPFPKEIKEPNLPLILNFDYVPSKN